MPAGNLGVINIDRSEALTELKTDDTTEFTEALTIYNQELENLRGLNDEGLTSNRVRIRGVNIYSVQRLYLHVIFWGSRTFAGTHIDSVFADLRKVPTFRIGNTGRYYYAATGLDIPYEDSDGTYVLHTSLQNYDPVAKNAGATGAVQLEILYSPRL